jgi:hypothetical protein
MARYYLWFFIRKLEIIDEGVNWKLRSDDEREREWCVEQY